MRHFLTLTALASIISTASMASEWGYEGANGPEHWGKVSATCALGKNQSPVNITGELGAKMTPVTLSYSGKVTSLINNGHTIQAQVSGDNELVVDGTRYKLMQFHFHTPSENRIHGQPFPLEAHFVHQDVSGNLAVLAVMFKVGEAGDAIAVLTGNVPENGQSRVLPHPVSLNEFIPQTDAFYRYNGSLTTPPCSEGVRWLIARQPMSVTEKEIKALQGEMGKNNRPLQPLNARVVINSL